MLRARGLIVPTLDLWWWYGRVLWILRRSLDRIEKITLSKQVSVTILHTAPCSLFKYIHVLQRLQRLGVPATATRQRNRQNGRGGGGNAIAGTGTLLKCDKQIYRLLQHVKHHQEH